MEPRIPIDMKTIEHFCDKWKVYEFSLFGSVLREDFGPESDVDVLIRIHDDAPWSLWDVIDMTEELQKLFHRKVDLVEADTIRNPFRRSEILNNRKVIYAE